MKKLLVLLDFGHGANTPGKCSPDFRLQEWKWNRDFGKMVLEMLDKEGIKAIPIITEDGDLALGARCRKANNIWTKYKDLGYDECLLISIHVNAADKDGWHNARGFTCWVYERGSEKSRRAGTSFANMAKVMQLTGNRVLPPEGYNTANFYILKNTNMPAILCENMFQDNKEDVDFLLSQEGKEKLLRLYRNSILNYQANL